MKLPRLIILLTVFSFLPFASPPARAQVVEGPPRSIDYQGKALDSGGAVLASANYTMQFRIYDAATGGNIVWSESQVVTVKDGLFSVRIGEGNAISTNNVTEGTTRDLRVAFNSSERYLGVTINIPTQQTSGEITPRLAFLAAPFAIVSQRAVLADNATNAAVASSVSQSTGSSTFKDASFTGTQTVATANITTANVSSLSSTGTITGSTVSSTNFTGNGQNLTSLNADQLLTGTVPDARISGNFAHTNTGQTWFGSNSFTGSLFCAAVNASSYSIPSGNGSYNGNGAGLTNLNANNLAAGTVPDGRLDPNIPRLASTTAAPQTIAAPQTFSGPNYFNHTEANYTGTEFFSIIRVNQNLARANSPNWQLWANPNSDLYIQSSTGHGYICSSDGSGIRGLSDVRLKKDITPVTGVLDRVLKMQAVSFRFKTSPEDTQKVIGFVAQDVEPLFPEVVSNKDEYKTMTYSELIPVAITAVQEEHKLRQESDEERQAEIEVLRRQNKELETRLNTIGKRLDSLDKRGRH